MRLVRTLLAVLICATALISCTQVRPWERGYLARDEMAWQADSLEGALNDHIFF